MQITLIRRHVFWLIIAAWVYTLTFIFNNYWSKYASYDSVTKSFQASVTQRENRFRDWVKDTSYLKDLSTGVRSKNDLQEVRSLPFYVFLFNAGDSSDVPVFWSTNAVLPDPYHVSFYPSGSFVKYGNGQYELLKRELKLDGKPFVVVGLVQLHEEFFIENGMLRKEYPGFTGLGDKMDLTNMPTDYAINGENKTPLVYFQPRVKEPIYIFNWLSFLVQCIASVLLIIFITKLCNDLIKNSFHSKFF